MSTKNHRNHGSRSGTATDVRRQRIISVLWIALAVTVLLAVNWRQVPVLVERFEHFIQRPVGVPDPYDCPQQGEPRHVCSILE